MKQTGQLNEMGQMQVVALETKTDLPVREIKIVNDEKHGNIVVINEVVKTHIKLTPPQYLAWYNQTRDMQRSAEESISADTIKLIEKDINDFKKQVEEMAPHIDILDKLINEKTRNDQKKTFLTMIKNKLAADKVNENFICDIWKKLAPEIKEHITNELESDIRTKLSKILLRHKIETKQLERKNGKTETKSTGMENISN